MELTIRFSASLPDLLLSVPSSLHANTATLKQLIRSHLPESFTKRRIRLIYSGKALIDNVPLQASLKKNVSSPPSRLGTPDVYDESSDARTDTGNGKGKQAVRDPVTQPRIYIHCSIGDIDLPAKELADEAATAAEGQADHDNDVQSSQDATAEKSTQAAATANTTPAPRGFDRLLSAGFSAAEVQSLRLQFLAIQAHTHTPDTMPGPAALRDLEDRWLDNSNATGEFDGDGTTGAGLGEDDLQAGALDDMIWGTAMGFFWPIGCLLWGVRDEGIWSQRRKMAVVVGCLLNVGLGLIRFGG
jgi:iron-sulfur cluster assembly 1